MQNFEEGNSSQNQLDEGNLLPLMEEFYTLQGEGFHTGKAAYFVRIGGCDIGCAWCDSKLSWNRDLYPPVSIDEVCRRILAQPAKSVVVTGGEPTQYNLEPFTKMLKNSGIQTFLETSGAYPLTGEWDWICLSPKQHSQCRSEYHYLAHELKVIIENVRDLKWAETNARLVHSGCMLFLQPEWSVHAQITPLLVDYVRKHPQWRLSLQTHKYIGIP